MAQKNEQTEETDAQLKEQFENSMKNALIAKESTEFDVQSRALSEMEIEEIPSTHDPDSTALYQLTKKAIQFPLRFDSETVPQPDDTVITQVKKQKTTQYPIPTLSDSKTVDDEVEVAMDLQEGVGVSLISKVSHFTVEPTGGHTVQATATVGVVGLQTELDPATGCLRGAVECLCSAESTHGESSTLLAALIG